MTGEELKNKIKESGVRFADIARALEISDQALHMWFRAKVVSTATVESIAKAMGVSVSYFYNEYPILSIEDYAEIQRDKERMRNLSELVATQRDLIETLKEQVRILEQDKPHAIKKSK